MSDLNVSLILKFVDKATAPARAALKALDRFGLSSFTAHAERIRKGTQAMAGEFQRWTRLVKGGTAVLGAYGLSMTAIGLAFIRPAAQFERFQVQLTTLEGSADGAKRAMSWIEDFATRTPLELEQTVAAYAKLKAFGIDPTNGALQAAVDTMAATGGGADQLDGIVLALGQSWTKQKLQGEEAMQLLERGVPVWDLLGKKLGKTTAEVQEMATKGKLGRKEISLLIEALGEANKGASDNMSKTWDGIISNLMDYWTKFQRMVMGSGVFDFLKGRLQDLLTLLNQMAADGRLQVWADRVAEAILKGLNMTWTFGQGVVSTWQTMMPWVQGAVDLFGGFKNVLMLIIGLNFARSLWVIAAAFGPVGIAIAAVATAGVLIYQNWDKIVAYFKDVIERLKAWFASLKQSIGEAFTAVIDRLAQIFDPQVWFQKGVAVIQALWDGMKSLVSQMVEWVKSKIAGIIPDMPDWLKGHKSDVVAGAPNRAAAIAGRAIGGPVRAGQIYRWMEEGQEFFSPRSDGSVISTRELKALRGPPAAGRSFRMGDLIINAAPGQSPEDIGRAVRRELERLARAAGAPLHDGGAYA